MANSLDDYPSLNRFLRIFSFLMRASNVEGGNPSAAAAPLGPDIRPRLCVRADIIIFRSCSESSSLTSSRVCGVRFEQGIDGSHELSTQNIGAAQAAGMKKTLRSASSRAVASDRAEPGLGDGLRCQRLGCLRVTTDGSSEPRSEPC